MNAFQRTITIGAKLFLFICDWFVNRADEPTPTTTPNPNYALDQRDERTYPVWNGELDEPIWW